MTVGYPWEREYATVEGVTELRVHGVGGTTPQTMLFDPMPTEVAGDTTAGFWRTHSRAGRRLEAYSWGGLTSRAATRAFWVLLMPFTFANVAGWMQYHPGEAGPGKSPPARHGPDGVLVKLLCLSLTVLGIAGAATISLDLIAYQCGGHSECFADRWWLWPLSQGQFSERPGQRLVLGAIAPLLLLGVLWYLGRRTARRYESITPPGAIPESEGPLLLRPSTWDGEVRVRGEQEAHLAAGIALIAGLVALAAGALARQNDEGAALGVVIAVAATAVLVVAAAVLLGEGKQSKAVLAAAGAVLVGACVWAWTLPAFTTRRQVLPGISRTGEVVFGVQLILLIALAFVITARLRRARPCPPAFRWAGPVVLSALSIFMVGSVVGGGMLRVADVLGQPADSAMVRSSEVVIFAPASYDWLSMLFAIGLAGTVLGGLAAIVWWLRMPKDEVDKVMARYPNAQEGDRGCAAGVAKAERLAQLPRKVDAPLSAGIGLVLLIAVVSYLVRIGGGEVWRAYPTVDSHLSWLRNGASWAVTMLPVLAVGLVASSYRSSAKRRTVGIIWDLGTFWPRWFHPLAPPCYAERAIPELQCRILRLTNVGGRVVLSAHSQGTVWATVALRMLPPEHRERMAYVTYGSPLTYLYPTLFPDHFPAVHEDLADSLSPAAPAAGFARWRNFWRRTDPIGGPVDTGDPLNDPEPLLDPVPPLCQCGACGRINGHSHYLEDEPVDRHIAGVGRAISASSPVPNAGATPPDPPAIL
ncbi:MAG: hypothetical protein ACRD12_13100 [Acidimicrobiales bacterium]